MLRLAVLSRVGKQTNKVLSFFPGSLAFHRLDHSRTDKIKCIFHQLQPASQPGCCYHTYTRSERKPIANNAWLDGIA